jgi:hypothetical protein
MNKLLLLIDIVDGLTCHDVDLLLAAIGPDLVDAFGPLKGTIMSSYVSTRCHVVLSLDNIDMRMIVTNLDSITRKNNMIKTIHHEIIQQLEFSSDSDGFMTFEHSP